MQSVWGGGGGIDWKMHEDLKQDDDDDDDDAVWRSTSWVNE